MLLKEDLEKYIAEGLSANKIAERCGVGFSTVRYWMNKYQLKTNYQSLRERTRYHMTAEERAEADRLRHKRYYEANKKSLNTNSAKRQREVGRRRKKEALASIGLTGCARCGYDKCMEAIEFHHCFGEKKFNLDKRSLSNRSTEVIQAELAKCTALCANCHREFHAGLFSINKDANGKIIFN